MHVAGSKAESHLNVWKLTRRDIELQELGFALLGFSLSLVQCFLTVAPLLSFGMNVYSAPLYVGRM